MHILFDFAELCLPQNVPMYCGVCVHVLYIWIYTEE